MEKSRKLSQNYHGILLLHKFSGFGYIIRIDAPWGDASNEYPQNVFIEKLETVKLFSVEKKKF